MKNNQSQKNIPDGWKRLPVDQVFTFVKSYAFSRDNLSNGILSIGKIGNIHYGDIHATFTSENIDLSKVEIPIIKEDSFSPKKEELLKDGDLIMADASEDYDGIGVTVSVHGIGKNKVVGGLHTFVLRDEKGLTSEYYRQYIFLNKEIRNKLQKVANGVSVYGISKTALSKMELPLPSTSEQNRIVSVLETWDKSIEKLEQKIETKKQIKKGLMQDLLTGKKRLSGFKEKWEIIKLGEVSKTSSGGTPKSTNENFYGGDISWVSIADMTASGKYIYKTMKNLSREGLENSAAKIYPKGTILYAMYASIGECSIAGVEMSSSQAILGITPDKEKLDSIFLYFYLCSIKEEIKLQGQQGTQSNLNAGMVRDFRLTLPSIEEQVNIVNILTIADDEIDELEKKLSLMKDQKRYLLNNLITGTIRTPETLSTKS
jgi:type I restriction enzyme S subunit